MDVDIAFLILLQGKSWSMDFFLIPATFLDDA